MAEQEIESAYSAVSQPDPDEAAAVETPTAATPAQEEVAVERKQVTEEPSKDEELPAWQRAKLAKEANRRREAEEQARRAEARAAALELAMQQQAAAARGKAAPDDPEPQPEGYDDPAKYNVDLIRWSARQEAKALVAAEREAIRAEERDRGFQSQLRAAQERYDDFTELTVQNQSLAISPAMAQAIKASDVGAELFYWFGKNPQEAQRLYFLNGAALEREVGKIEGKLTATPKAVSKAPEPIKPLGAGSKPPSLVGREDESMDEIAARQRKAMGIGM